MLSKQNRLIRFVFEKGYRVSACGLKLFNPQGKELKINKQCKRGKYYNNFTTRCPVDKNPTRVYLHKLKAYQLFGEKVFQANMVIRHYNDDSLDNSDTNLKLGTQLENMEDKARNANSKSTCPF